MVPQLSLIRQTGETRDSNPQPLVYKVSQSGLSSTLVAPVIKKILFLLNGRIHQYTKAQNLG